MSSSPKIQRERKRQGLCVGCGKKPKAGCLRCESCLQKQRDYDSAWRAKQKGATVEPQCKIQDRMRAEHIFDEDGLCDCGARKMEFAPRPPLRPEIVRAAAPKRVATPAMVAKGGFVERLASKPKAKSAPPAEKHIGGTTFSALIADLERQRDALDTAITGLRGIEQEWPR